MANLLQPAKSQKNSIGGSGIQDLGTVQQINIPTTGVAFNLTSWIGREVCIHVSAETYLRWSDVATPTTMDATTTAASAAAPVATGPGSAYSGIPNFRDVPTLQNRASAEGVFLIVAAASGTVNVRVELTG